MADNSGSHQERQQPTEQIALTKMAMVASEKFEFGRLHAFGWGLEIEMVCQADNCPDDFSVVGFRTTAGNEGFITR
jgi:hypothetical protein